MDFIINKNLRVECEVYETRYSWGHKAWLYRDGREVDYIKITYYNRTWEAYQFESILETLSGSKQLTDRESKLLKKKIKIWGGQEVEKVNKSFGTLAAVMAMGEIFTDNQKSANDWKIRMLKAGLENKGLIMPEDWESLTEDEKQKRLDGVIDQFSK